MAREAGVLVSVASEAPCPAGLANLMGSLGQGRRGWLEVRHVLNAQRPGGLRPLLATTMGRRVREPARA